MYKLVIMGVNSYFGKEIDLWTSDGPTEEGEYIRDLCEGEELIVYCQSKEVILDHFDFEEEDIQEID